jgi:ABC-type dipeptide/oligopeptide/nickel transport system permease component
MQVLGTVEPVPGLPGLGRVMSGIVLVAILVLRTNLLIDALYGVIDPRVRVQAS